MFGTGAFALGLGPQSTLHPAEQNLVNLLVDDAIQVISSFELNRMASLTYHETSIANGEDLCEKIFEILEKIVSKPADFSVVTLLKALVITKHILIFGADRVIQDGTVLGRHLEPLLNYNTVIMAHQQAGAVGVLMRIKGGGVDKGGPVREKAQQVHRLLSDVNYLKSERLRQADPTSLVPVGDDRIAFVTDEVRLYALKRRMDQERDMQTRSNLAKAEGGFGGGYNSRDGKNVVGAAHGLDEMLKRASQEKKKFSDDGGPPLYEGYVAPQFDEDLGQDIYSQETVVGDLLSMDGAPATAGAPPQVEVDLLGIAPPVHTNNGTPGQDLLGLTASSTATFDLLGTASDHVSSTQTAVPSMATSNVLGSISDHTAAPSANVWGTADLLGGMSLAYTSSSLNPAPVVAPVAAKRPIMGSNTIRFSALDELQQPSASSGSALAAENRILGLKIASSSILSGSRPAHSDAFSGLNLLGTTSSESKPALLTIATSRIQISESHVPSSWLGNVDDNDGSNGFVMGGTVGTGLQPVGEPPSQPPPPPPPSAWM